MSKTTKRHPRLRIEGEIKLITPLHVTSFDQPEGTGVNITQAMTTVVHTAAGRVLVPYVPGNSIRGAMRRAIGYRILDRLAPDVEPWMFQYLTNSSTELGIATGAITSIKETAAAFDDVYLGVFGGGPLMVKGAFDCGLAYLITPETIEAGIVPPEYEPASIRRSAAAEAPATTYARRIGLERYTIVKRDDLDTMNDQRIPSYFQDFESVAIEWRQKAMDNSAERKAAKKASDDAKAERREARAAGKQLAAKAEDLALPKPKKETVANLVTFEAVAPGAALYFRLDTRKNLLDEQVYAVVDAVAQAFSERIGGKHAAGFGLVEPRLTVTGLDGDQRTKHPALQYSAELGRYTAGPAFEAMKPAFVAAIDAYSLEHTLRMMNGGNEFVAAAKAADLEAVDA